MANWTFSFNGINGLAQPYIGGVWISWGGMGFHLDAANEDLRAAILNAN
jgi:hypothetical protein